MTDFYVQGDGGGEGYADTSRMEFRKGIRMEVTPDAPLRVDGDPAVLSDESGSEMDTQEPYRDLVDDPDERMTNPTLYLQKFWRKVSPQAPIYHCYRNAAKRSYICKLTVAIPPSGTRTYTSEAAFPSKRSAKRAVSEYAIHKGILDLAQESMAQTDRIGTDNAPHFRPKPLPRRDERFNIVPILSNQEEETVASAQNPVTALNLAVQRYCVETPSQALLYAHESGSSAVGNYRLHGCTLTVRITPDIHEMYRTNVDFTSAKAAKEAATRLALQEGIVTLLKLHNSFTSKVCRQLGLAIPLTLEEHDPVEEENSAGTLGQLVQEVTRNPLAMECEYTTAIQEGTELHGAKLCIAVKADDVRRYEMSPCLKSKKDAKEAVCRLAARSGLEAELEAQRRLLQASRLAINRLGPRQAGFSSLIPPKAGTVQPDEADYLENAVAYLNVSMQAYTGRPDVLVFEFSEIGPMHTLARSINARFGCTLTARLAAGRVLRYEVVPEFPTKKAAKESVAKLAVKQGLVEEAKQAKEFSKFGRSPSLAPSSSFSRSGTPISSTGSHRSEDLFAHILAGPGGYPSLHRQEDVRSNPDEDAASYPYATFANSRPLVPVVQAPVAHEALTAPPPYVDTRAAQPLQTDGTGRWPASQPSHSSNPLVARQQYLSQQQTRGSFPPSGETSTILSTDSSASSGIAERTRPFAADVSQYLQTSAHTSAAQTYMTAIDEKATSKIGEGAKGNHISYTCEASPDGKTYSGTLLLRDPAGREYAFSTPVSYPSRRLAQEAAAQKAVHEGLLALIDREWSPAAIARRKRETEDGPPSLAREQSPEAKIDPFSQPVSYLHQVCQLFLGHGDSDRPHYDLTKKEHTTLYGAFLTIKTSPFSIYKTDMIYTGKAAAKDAVSRMALEDDIIGKLKLTMLKALAPKGELAVDIAHAAQVKQERDEALLARSAAPAEEQSKDSGSDDELKITLDKPKPPPKPKVSHVVQLEEYCRTTKRPTPQWKVDPSPPDGSNSATTTQLSVRIADETFESPKATKKGDQGGREKLARLVLKHLQKKDGVTEASVSVGMEQ